MKQLLRLQSLTILFVLSFSMLAGQNSDMVSVTGKLLNNNNPQILYLDIFQAQSTLSDSVRPGPAGEFSFKVKVPETNFLRLRMSDKNFLMLVVFPGDNIEVQLQAEQMGINPVIKGSPVSLQIYDFTRFIGVFDRRTDSLNTAAKSYEGSPARDSVMPLLQKAYENNESARIRVLKDFISKNTGSLAAMFFIDKLDMDEQFDSYKILSAGLNAKYPTNPYVAGFVGRVAENEKTAVGSPAPDIALPDTTGKVISLSSLRGKVVIIDFWAAWCGPCRRENPNMVKLYQKYHEKGLEIYGVSLDKTRDAWIKAIKADNLVWYEVSDLLYWKSEAAKTYKVGAIPYTVLLDKDGIILAKKLRGQPLEDRLKEIFGF